MASVKGDPSVDQNYLTSINTLKSQTTTSTLRNLDQKSLREVARTLKKMVADVEFYLDVRNEQGRGGKN